MMLNWNELEAQCLSCQKCALADKRTNVVFGVGPRDAEVMFIGEGPGENEDLQGEPFGAGGASCWTTCWSSSTWTGIRTSTLPTSSSAVRLRTGTP